MNASEDPGIEGGTNSPLFAPTFHINFFVCTETAFSGFFSGSFAFAIGGGGIGGPAGLFAVGVATVCGGDSAVVATSAVAPVVAAAAEDAAVEVATAEEAVVEEEDDDDEDAAAFSVAISAFSESMMSCFRLRGVAREKTGQRRVKSRASSRTPRHHHRHHHHHRHRHHHRHHHHRQDTH